MDNTRLATEQIRLLLTTVINLGCHDGIRACVCNDEFNEPYAR